LGLNIPLKISKSDNPQSAFLRQLIRFGTQPSTSQNSEIINYTYLKSEVGLSWPLIRP